MLSTVICGCVVIGVWAWNLGNEPDLFAGPQITSPAAVVAR